MTEAEYAAWLIDNGLMDSEGNLKLWDDEIAKERIRVDNPVFANWRTDKLHKSYDELIAAAKEIIERFNQIGAIAGVTVRITDRLKTAIENMEKLK